MSILRGVLFTGKKIAWSVRAMSGGGNGLLINDPKYSWIRELGLQENNPGVFDGTWRGSGQV